MRAARFPALSSPNFFTTPNGNAVQRRPCWNRSTARRILGIGPLIPTIRGRSTCAYGTRRRVRPNVPPGGSAGRRLDLPGLRDHDEADLTRLHHAQAFAGHLFEVGGAPEQLD